MEDFDIGEANQFQKMKIQIINPPHTAIGSRLANEHLPPLGLLSIAGPLIDSGHQVVLTDADYFPLRVSQIMSEIEKVKPEIILMGHSGSTSAQPMIDQLSKEIKAFWPSITIIIGGVYPTYHWREILSKNSNIDFIVCGEGEAVITELIKPEGIEQNLKNVKGIAFRDEGLPVKTTPAPLIQNLDDYRVAWELMEAYNYTYWGKKKAVVIQFSRGCPYPCTYCGQSLFWQKFRNRNPKMLADEMEMLHRKFGVKVFNFADENPSSNPRDWREFLRILSEKNLDLILVGSIRADNIVRDREYLHLYKKAGFERFLLGIENYDAVVLERIKKAGEVSKDKEAIQLLRQHGILSMATYVVGFGDESTKDFLGSLKQLLSYDPDQVQLLYATPHKWTPYFEEVKENEIILLDQRYWDYKHQVLKTRKLPAWLVVIYVKSIEIIMQTRPKALWRLFFHQEKKLRKAMWWYTKIGRRVWFFELFQFFFKIKHTKESVKMKEFWK